MSAEVTTNFEKVCATLLRWRSIQAPRIASARFSTFVGRFSYLTSTLIELLGYCSTSGSWYWYPSSPIAIFRNTDHPRLRTTYVAISLARPPIATTRSEHLRKRDRTTE